jgi:SAM-dependent methyltransferase
MDYALVAHLYDLYARTDIDVAFFVEEARNCAQVLELTSGTGRLSIPLLEAGVPLTCVDSSPEMLERLRAKLIQKGLQAEVYEMDMTRLSLPGRYDLIMIPFNAFAEVTDARQQAEALARIRSHHAARGRFICTLHNPPVRLRTVDGVVHPRGMFDLPDSAGNLALSSVEHYDPHSRLVTGKQIYELYDPQDNLISKTSIPLEFMLHSREDFETLARQSGFEILQVYGDYQRANFDPEQSPFIIEILR